MYKFVWWLNHVSTLSMLDVFVVGASSETAVVIANAQDIAGVHASMLTHTHHLSMKRFRKVGLVKSNPTLIGSLISLGYLPASLCNLQMPISSPLRVLPVGHNG